MERSEPSASERGDITRLLRQVAENTDVDLSKYRQAYVERRIATRLSALRLETYRQYARHLDREPAEYARLLSALTINVTDFFRDPPVYQEFRKKIVPEIIADKARTRRRMIRAWSAGCATGEEAYSLAMSFLSELGPRAVSYILSVTGTDLDPDALETARTATYDNSELRQIPRADQANFLDVGPTTFKLRSNVTDCVRFKRLNLFTDEPIRVVDVIFCRNVFIYFTREQQAYVLDLFARSLVRRGYLALGRSEKLAVSVSDHFEVIDGRNRLYRRR